MCFYISSAVVVLLAIAFTTFRVYNERGARLWLAETPRAKLDIPGTESKTIVITGSNTGIGLEEAVGICVVGARTVMACRDMVKCDAAAASVRTRCRAMCADMQKTNQAKKCPVSVETIKLDLSALSSIDEFVAAYRARYGNKLDVLVNNAALGSAGGKVWNQNNTITEVFYVNHLAVTYLTQKMLPVLLATPNSRIVDVASGAHAAGVLSLRDFGGLEVKDSQMQLYGASKAANIVHARHLARLLDKCGVSTKVFSLHPGIIRTELHRNDPALNQYLVWVLHMLIAITPWQGAQNTIHLATTMDPAVLNTSGAYYSWFDVTKENVRYDPPTTDAVKTDAEFMKLSARVLGIKNPETCEDLQSLN